MRHDFLAPAAAAAFAFVAINGNCSWQSNANQNADTPHGGEGGSADGGTAGAASGGADSGHEVAKSDSAGAGMDSSASATEGGATMGEPVEAGGSPDAEALGPIIGTPLATFDSDANGFTLNLFSEATNLAIAPTPATATWIATDGSPGLGCMKITAPYSGPNQWVDLEARNFTAPLPSWSGRTLHVRIKLDPSGTFSGTARLYVKTGTAYVFYPNLDPYPRTQGWQEFVLPLVSPAPVPPANAGADPVQVITFGVDPEVSSDPPVTPTPVTFYVDSFSIE